MLNIFTDYNKIINTKGLRCPEPMMIIKKVIRKMIEGEKLLIITDDPATIRDIPIFCYFMKHKLIDKKNKKSIYYYLISKY